MPAIPAGRDPEPGAFECAAGGLGQIDRGEHQIGLVEHADEVLAVARIDAGLAADRGIDLRQKACGQLHEIHAAPRDRRLVQFQPRVQADLHAGIRAIVRILHEIESRLAELLLLLEEALELLAGD